MISCIKSLYSSHSAIFWHKLEHWVLVVHFLSPAAEDGEDHDLGVSDDSGDMK